jgi:hypothetical protein
MFQTEEYFYEPCTRLHKSSKVLFRRRPEPAFVADCGDGSNKDDCLVMCVPGAWMVVLHPVYRIFRTEDLRRAPDQGCSTLSAVEPRMPGSLSFSPLRVLPGAWRARPGGVPTPGASSRTAPHFPRACPPPPAPARRSASAWRHFQLPG